MRDVLLFTAVASATTLIFCLLYKVMKEAEQAKRRALDELEKHVQEMSDYRVTCTGKLMKMRRETNSTN